MLISRHVVRIVTVLFTLVSLTSSAAPALSPLSESEPMFMRVNGVALDVRSALVPIPRESLASAILDAWRVAGTEGRMFEASGDRLVLGRQTGPLHETLSLLRTDDPLMTAVVRALQDSRQILAAAPPPPFALPEGMRIIGTTEDLAGQRPSIIYRIDALSSPRDSLERIRLALVDAKWQLISRRINDNGPFMLEATRDQDAIFVTVSREERTTRVVISVEFGGQ